MDVFISHSRADLTIVREISNTLIAAHLKIWWDSMKLRFGDELSPSIFAAIDDSTVFLYVSSQSSMNSDWVQRELDYALKREVAGKLRIVPVRVDNSDLPVPLQDRVYIEIDVTNQDPGLERISTTLITLAKTPPPTARSLSADGNTFIDHAIEVRRLKDAALVINLDAIAVDLEERYSILSQFEFESEPAFEDDYNDLEQAHRLIRACAASFAAEPARIFVRSGAVHRFELELDDGPHNFQMRVRIRRLGKASLGQVVVSLGTIFGILETGHLGDESHQA